MTSAIDERRRALEESFFTEQNQALVNRLKAEKEANAERDVLARIAGIEDDHLLDELVAAGVTVQSFAALSLYPLVAVAWADGKLDEKEKRAVLHAAHERGIEEDNDAHKLLEQWLASRPSNDMNEVWSDYVAALRETLDQPQFGALHQEIMKQSEDVARSAGGILGVGSISASEQRKLDELRAVFDG